LQVGALRRRNACGGNIGQQYYLFIGQLVGNFRQVCLGVGHEQIFRLSTVDGVTELPSAE